MAKSCRKYPWKWTRYFQASKILNFCNFKPEKKRHIQFPVFDHFLSVVESGIVENLFILIIAEHYPSSVAFDCKLRTAKTAINEQGEIGV